MTYYIGKCKIDCCEKQAIYNYKNHLIGIRCLEHIELGMVNIKHRKHCEIQNCIKEACFNYKNEEDALFCSIHREKEMVNKKIKYCAVKGCFNKRVYTYRLKKTPLYCCVHKDDDMIDVVNKICPKCNFYNGYKNYKDLCLYCFCDLYPTQKLNNNMLVKQRLILDDVRNYIDINYKNNLIYTYFINKKILGGYSKYRPDFLLILNNKNIIIEVDEYQHKRYKNENERIDAILNDLKNQFTFIIRINCDEDTLKESMFIKIDNKIEVNNDIYNKKIKILYETIDYAIKNNNFDKKYFIKYLYYKN